MKFTNKILTCSYCGVAFTFDTKEQHFFAAQGYTNVPRRCPNCRVGRKAEQGGGFGYYTHYSTQRLMYPVICAECGGDTEAPFEPRDGRPAYCNKCYGAVRSAS